MINYLKKIAKKSKTLRSIYHAINFIFAICSRAYTILLILITPKKKIKFNISNKFNSYFHVLDMPKVNITNQENYDLTIIIPIYNVEKYLAKCLKSIVCQKTKYLYEIIIIDDCSPDNSACIANEFKKKYNNIKIFSHLSNRGLGAARNAGLQYATGKYIMFVDSDDFIFDNAIDILMDGATKFNADICCGSNTSSDMYERRKLNYYSVNNKSKMFEKIGYSAWGKVYKKELFNHVTNIENAWFEDNSLFLLMPYFCKKIVFTNHLVYYYNKKNSDSITSTSKNKITYKSLDKPFVISFIIDYIIENNFDVLIGFYKKIIIELAYSCSESVKLLPLDIKESTFIYISNSFYRLSEYIKKKNKKITLSLFHKSLEKIFLKNLFQIWITLK